MTARDLGAECLKILETARPPTMSAASISKVLYCTGWSADRIGESKIETVLDALVDGGQLERGWRWGAKTYRAMNGRKPAQQ